MTYFRAPTNGEIRAAAERKRQALVAQTCDAAISMLLSDTGPLAALPSDIMIKIRGQINSAICVLIASRDDAETKSEHGVIR